ncbi:hypothetical protein [Bradyrhizobium agreste]|nr:hypothetical protein [Bradyrhizobium agreste]
MHVTNLNLIELYFRQFAEKHADAPGAQHLVRAGPDGKGPA